MLVTSGRVSPYMNLSPCLYPFKRTRIAAFSAGRLYHISSMSDYRVSIDLCNLEKHLHCILSSKPALASIAALYWVEFLLLVSMISESK